MQGREQAIGNELSLGMRWDAFSSNSNQAANTQRRHALRALLLCQRIYFSELWPCLMGTTATRQPVHWLSTDWKEQSARFWGAKAELEIQKGLRMFTITSQNVNSVADKAILGHPSTPSMPFLTATRESFNGDQATATCYDAVMLWLFLSGIVSLRWLLRYRNANTQETLTEAFGSGRTIWEGPFGEGDVFPDVPRGHIVHIFENRSSWRGHWMVSTGAGKSAGCNNNDENPPVSRNYCPSLTLKKQFLDYGGGTAVVIHPTQIPGRM